MKITTPEDMQEAAKKIYGMGAGAVLVKGGHYIGDARDILFDGRKFHTYVEKRIDTKNTHGTGCTLSSAIASLPRPRRAAPRGGRQGEGLCHRRD